ncbi:MAG: phosphohydrolase [Acidobacteria bacterium]|nr:MAG: phosphohydrolase [Acidobacteriota bacterium]
MRASKSSSTTGKRRVVPRPKLGKRFNQALTFASRMHGQQTKKGTEVPYIAHLLGVAALVLEAGGDEDLAIAALLHDVVEDCGGVPVLKEIRRRFGARVAHIVDGCTDAYTFPKPPWRERKEQYLHRLRRGDAGTRLVSAADKLYNVRSIVNDYREIGESIWERFTVRREGTLWYYRALVKEFRRTPNRLSRELERAFRDLERIAGVNGHSDPASGRKAQ